MDWTMASSLSVQMHTCMESQQRKPKVRTSPAPLLRSAGSTCPDRQEATEPPCQFPRHSGVTYHLQAVRCAQGMTSLQGTETKIKISFNSSVVDYSFCLRLEDIRANKESLGPKASWGQAEGCGAWDRHRVERNIQETCLLQDSS